MTAEPVFLQGCGSVSQFGQCTLCALRDHRMLEDRSHACDTALKLVTGPLRLA